MQPTAPIADKPCTSHTVKRVEGRVAQTVCTHCVCKGSENENSNNGLKTSSNQTVALKTPSERCLPQTEFALNIMGS